MRPPFIWAKKATPISGWARNQRVMRPFQRTQPDRSGSGSRLTAREKGQWLRVMASTRQPFAWAATSSGACQFIAWLSPTSATVSAACAGGTPKAQMPTAPRRIVPAPIVSIRVHGRFGISCASAGVGTTDSRSSGFRHGRSGSRAAAPKQAGAGAAAAAHASASDAPAATTRALRMRRVTMCRP